MTARCRHWGHPDNPPDPVRMVAPDADRYAAAFDALVKRYHPVVAAVLAAELVAR